MAEAYTPTAHTAWYRRGTVSVTNGSTKVSGDGTKFLTAGINPGSTFRTDARSSYACEVAEVVSDTELRLVMPYYGQTASGQTYSIDCNHQSTLPADLANRLSKAMGNWEARYDEDMKTITGESAFEIAKRLGKTNAATEAAWIEELKAGTEYTALKNSVAALIANEAGNHNAQFFDKNLGVFSEAISANIRNGSFVDIFPGCYFDFSNIPYEYLDENDEKQESTYSGRMRIMDLDYLLRCGDTDLNTHHVVVVPDANMFSSYMNPENKTEGGYVGSVMRTKVLRRAEAIFKACFGEDHILSHREYLVNAVADGRPSASVWCDSLVELMDERMVYGSCIYDSGASDGVKTFNRHSVTNAQFAGFRHKHALVSNRQWFWLRNVVAAWGFAFTNAIGICCYNSASDVNGGVRPFALVY